MKLFSRARLSATPWTAACLPGFSVRGIFQEEYRSGLPFPSPGDLPNPGSKLRTSALVCEFFAAELPLISVSVKPCAFNNSSEYSFIVRSEVTGINSKMFVL